MSMTALFFVLLAVAVAVGLALWLTRSRRPDLPTPNTGLPRELGPDHRDESEHIRPVPKRWRAAGRPDR
jgi:hypothetical protein